LATLLSAAKLDFILGVGVIIGQLLYTQRHCTLFEDEVCQQPV